MGPKRDFSDEIRFKDKKDFLTKLNKLGDLSMKKLSLDKLMLVANILKVQRFQSI